MIAGVGAIGVHVLAPPDTKARIARGAREAADEGWELLQVLLTTSGKAIGEIEGLSPGSVPLRDGSYDPEALLRRIAPYTVARARSSHVSAEQLSQMLRGLAVLHGEKKVREVLRRTPTFEEIYRGRFQVGRALVRQAALPLAGAA